MSRTALAWVVFAGLLTSCGNFVEDNEQLGSSDSIPAGEKNQPQIADTTFLLNGRFVSILSTKKELKGLILCLPGWNFSRMDVCEKSDFCQKAMMAGYVLILPEMEKSIYASQAYTETRKDWLGFPQLRFVTDTLLPHLQNEFGLLMPSQSNFLYGISTGGRGVALLAIATDSLFRAGASLSGDFNQMLDTKDNLMKMWYGPHEQFPERWKTDNPSLEAHRVRIPLYLAHGADDNIVDPKQTQLFYTLLEKLNPGRGHKLHIRENAQHDYKFWGAESDSVLEFFTSRCR